jgi:hypothetical protein
MAKTNKRSAPKKTVQTSIKSSGSSLSVTDLNVNGIKKELKRIGLSTQGNKEELTERLLEAIGNTEQHCKLTIGLKIGLKHNKKYQKALNQRDQWMNHSSKIVAKKQM